MKEALGIRAELDKRYFAYPNILDPLPPVYRNGLIPLGLLAVMSLISVTALLIFITHRLISWRKHYKEYVGYNQYVILIYNLLLADLQQSIAFSISFHWLRIGKILAPTAPCWIQGWFLHIGDVASGLFVLAIAVHTWLGVTKGYKLPYNWFVVSIVAIWSFALLLTLLGPAMYRETYFARAGGWCWVSVAHENERLYLHYLWIFIVEFGTILIYGHIFIHLRGHIRSAMHNDTSKLSRATKFMVLYPAVYVVLTLPIAVGRMVSMSGKKLPDVYILIAGSLLTSCGWIDALLYTLTRRILVSTDISTAGRHTYSNNITMTGTNSQRPGDYGLQSMNKEMGARTVTIVGGSNRMSRLVERGRHIREKHGHPDPLGENSPTGSQVEIMKPGPNTIGIMTETVIQTESIRRNSADGDNSAHPSRSDSDSGITNAL